MHRTLKKTDRALEKAAQPTRARWTLVAGISLALAVLGGTIAWSRLKFREDVRAQIVARDGQILDAVAAMQHTNDIENEETLAPLDDPGEQFQLVLKISRLKNVVGVRLFAPDGTFTNAFPYYISEAALAADDLDSLKNLRPVSHYYPRSPLMDLVAPGGTNGSTAPLLVVNIPLRGEDQRHLAGVAQFLMDGRAIAGQYAELDGKIWADAAVAFAMGGGVLAVGLALAFHRVQRANRLLTQRTAHLLQANRDLALAAKVTAVGAVTSHLIHGLKNPLSGLSSFVRNHNANANEGSDTDWELATATTERMQALVNQVVRVLQEQQTAENYEITLGELEGMTIEKLKPAAESAGVQIESNIAAEGTLSNHAAELLSMILENLIQNAIDATPRGKTVRLAGSSADGRLALEVQDEGPGLPQAMESCLFTPCASSKKGGSGIGLAISKQLARYLGADLELRRSSSGGCVFRLSLPWERLSTPTASSLDAAPLKG